MLPRQRLLLVEDDPEIGEMLRLFFSEVGYDFFHALDGAHGLDLAARMVPHLILMDITLPDADGFALTVKLRWRPRTAHIPVIFLTRYNRRDERLAALDLGASDFIAKPFNLRELLLRVQNGIARTSRERLTDLRTGLPAAFTARDRIAHARTDPRQAIIEVSLAHAIPYQVVYGSAAHARVCRQVADLLLETAVAHDDDEGFIGCLDEDQWVITTQHTRAQAIADGIAAAFARLVPGLYSPEDRDRGGVLVGGELQPLMQVACRVTLGAVSV
ncbi:MAG: response regulator [Chloroflexi bacterium]|nr:response regulator [Chloroflexota bacterium]